MERYDKWLLFVAVILTGFGALMIYSSTSVITPELAKKGATEFSYFKRHLFTIFIGFIFLLGAYLLKPSLIKKYSVPLLIISLVLLVLVFVPGIGVSAGSKEMDKTLALNLSALGAGKTCHGNLSRRVYVDARIQDRQFCFFYKTGADYGRISDSYYQTA